MLYAIHVCVIYIRDLSKTRNPKRPDQKYFDVNLISEVDSNDENYQDFLKEYGSYVVQRVKLFSNK
jgi:hypothetical protein